MKTFMSLCLLAIGASALAQTPVKTAEPGREAAGNVDEEQVRKQLAEARERLDAAARDVAELSSKLGANVRREMRVIEGGGPRRAVLGVQIDAAPGKEGARVLSVSPGGPAAEAGLRDNDIIVAIDGQALKGPNPDRELVNKMRDVKPDQKVKVVVLRDGKKHDYVVVARPRMVEDRVFAFQMPDIDVDAGAIASGIGTMPFVHQFRTFLHGEFSGLELATITPKLGSYFGVNEGVLVVQAPKDDTFKLEEGDVIQAIDGRKPADGPHALRILRSYKGGEKLKLSVYRQRKPLTLDVTMPERPEGDVMFHRAFPTPGAPIAPPAPRAPATPPAAGTVERAADMASTAD